MSAHAGAPRRRLGDSGFDVFPLCLGGNVFGGNADRAESFAVLDAYVAAGGNFVDTADMYVGGRSEEVLGEWMRERGNRGSLIVATKVGRAEGLKGLSPGTIGRAAEASLGRLGTDYVDLYYAHGDDPDVPLAETLGAFASLIDAGKVRQIAASNYEAPRLAEALTVSAREGLPRYIALQPHYNLVERARYEGELRDVCENGNVACLPYFALASGFLTGKYRVDAPIETPRRHIDDQRRTDRALAYLDMRGMAVLSAVDEIAEHHGASQSAVALAWLAAQPTVVVPLTSARTPEQLEDILESTRVSLGPDELGRLDEISDHGPKATN